MSEPRETYRNPEPCKRHGINSCLGCDNQIPVPTHGTEPEGEEKMVPSGALRGVGGRANEWKGPLWEGVHLYVRSCGGNPDKGVGDWSGKDRRLEAVATIETAVERAMTLALELSAPTEPKPGGEEVIERLRGRPIRYTRIPAVCMSPDLRDDAITHIQALTEEVEDYREELPAIRESEQVWLRQAIEDGETITKLQSALDGFEPWMVEWLHPSHPGPDMGELLAVYHGEITENYRPGFDSWLKTRIANRIKNALEAK